MQVTVKLVIFEHPECPDGDKYCSYCPELICSFGSGDTIEKVVEIVKNEYLLWELEGRFWYLNLYKRGWKISETEIIPPIFTDEEAVKLTEKTFELSLTEYQIVLIHVEAPEPKRRRDLSAFNHLL